MKFKRYSLCVDDNTYEQIANIAKSTDSSIADVTRELLNKALAMGYVEESNNIIARIIRDELKAILKPNVERLAALSSKSGHMAATAAFLNVQALMDLVPKDRQKNVREMYESARVKAVDYMRMRTDD